VAYFQNQSLVTESSAFLDQSPSPDNPRDRSAQNSPLRSSMVGRPWITSQNALPRKVIPLANDAKMLSTNLFSTTFQHVFAL